MKPASSWPRLAPGSPFLVVRAGGHAGHAAAVLSAHGPPRLSADHCRFRRTGLGGSATLAAAPIDAAMTESAVTDRFSRLARTPSDASLTAPPHGAWCRACHGTRWWTKRQRAEGLALHDVPSAGPSAARSEPAGRGPGRDSRPTGRRSAVSAGGNRSGLEELGCISEFRHSLRMSCA
jgi:hypothetical protein